MKNPPPKRRHGPWWSRNRWRRVCRRGAVVWRRDQGASELLIVVALLALPIGVIVARWSPWVTLGEAFAIVGTFVTLCAAALFGLSLKIQTRELRLQRLGLALTREELALQRLELDEVADHLKAQVREMETQRILARIDIVSAAFLDEWPQLTEASNALLEYADPDPRHDELRARVALYLLGTKAVGTPTKENPFLDGSRLMAEPGRDTLVYRLPLEKRLVVVEDVAKPEAVEAAKRLEGAQRLLTRVKQLWALAYEIDVHEAQDAPWRPLAEQLCSSLSGIRRLTGGLPEAMERLEDAHVCDGKPTGLTFELELAHASRGALMALDRISRPRFVTSENEQEPHPPSSPLLWRSATIT